MPFATIAKIREISSEDKVHLAENLICSKAGKKWKTKSTGENTAYVILELSTPQQICGIDIGNEHSAFIEVLVGKANSPPGDFKEILLTSSFMTPMESRNSTNINRVRCFNCAALVSSVAANKWSLIKVVCSQPFNKHVQYGLSFIKVHVIQENMLKAIETKKEISVTSRNLNFSKIGKYKLREESSDSDNENSSQLFNRWRTLKDDINSNLSKESTNENMNNSKSIFYSTSNVNLKNSTSATAPNPKCDEVQVLSKKQNHKESDKITINKQNHGKKSLESHNTSSSEINKRKRRKLSSEYANTTLKSDHTIKEAVTVKYKPFNRLLEHVTLVISGIQNPDRTILRNKALALGAKYKVSWDNMCTHLICAFKNTPKYNEVKGKGRIVKQAFLEKCYEQKMYLPWRRFALDESDSLKDESDEEILDETLRNVSQNEVVTRNASFINTNDTNCDLYDESPSTSKVLFNNTNVESDTDDEIERAQRKMQEVSNCDIYEATTEEEDYLSHKIKSTSSPHEKS